MKKVLKFLGIILLIIIAYVLIAGLFIKKNYHFERSVTINAPKEIIWQNVSRFDNFIKWNPFAAHDPNVKQTIEGTDGTVGAVYKWDGNKDVGKGSQTFVSITPQRNVGIDLLFEEPFESKAKVNFNINDDGNAQKVTWSFDSRSPYPWNAIMPFMNMDKMMGDEFTKGLQTLKNLCESGAATTQSPVPDTENILK